LRRAREPAATACRTHSASCVTDGGRHVTRR
jgi:hypothetical protein